MPKRLTSQSIKAMTPPAAGNFVEWDTEERGLGARITAAGSVAFVLRYVVVNGQERRMTLGAFPALSVSAAREKAREIKGAVAANRDKPRPYDPLEQRTGARNAADVRQLCADYLSRHAEQHKRETSRRNDREMIEKIIKPKLGGTRVANVTRRDIEDLHAGIKATPYRANRALALLSKMFSLAIEWGWRADNPARGIKRFPEEKRTRWLQTDELERLAKALDDYAAPRPRKSAPSNETSDDEAPSNVARKRAANAIRLLLLTGARLGEVLNAEWPHIDFERAVWTRPSAHTKQKRTEHVPLSPPALELLQSVKDDAPKTEAVLGRYIFPGNKADQPLRGIKRAWATICRDAKLDPSLADERASDTVARSKRKGRKRRAPGAVRLHDLRHTYASHLVSSGLSLPLVGRLLGHTQAATTQRYAHLADDPLREATGRMGALYEAVRGQRKPADVVHLHGNKGGAA